MKILIAYDGSQSASNAIRDLKNAGLPTEGVQATVLSVGEIRTGGEPALNIESGLTLAAYAIDNIQETIQYAREAAEEDACQGVKMVSALFPKWETTACARLHSPASTILQVAESLKPDLIVMGSHGRGAIGRLFLGSVSLRVASEAPCSVRIVRPRTHMNHNRPLTLLVSFDGSSGARKMVHSLVQRVWPMDTQLHIVAALDYSVLASPEYIWLAAGDVGIYQEMKESRIDQAVYSLEREMSKHFNVVTSAMPVGTASREILAQAKQVHADTIFIGSRGLSGIQRMLLGSVAHSIAAHAETTVEIVR
jgi:nucleotide-binding universal stress UspA family protein